MDHWPRWAKVILVVVSLLWILALYAGFYRVQKPFGVENALAWLRLVGELAAAAGIVLLGSASGRWLLRCMGFAWASTLEELVFSFALGLGVWALIVMGIGLAGGLYRWLFYLVTVVGLILLRREVRAVVQQALAARLALVLPRPLAMFFLFALALTFTLALTPPTAWDALQYHLDGPRLFIQQHRVTTIDNFSLAYSGLLESLFLWAMLLIDDAAAQLLHWIYGLGLLVMLYLGGRRMLGEKFAWVPVAVLGSMPMFFTLLPWAYNDLALAFYQVGAFLALCYWRDDKQSRWLVLSGLLSGFGLGFKYTAASVPLALALLVPFWQPWKKGNWFKSWAVFALSAAGVAAPWFARNWVLWGNPVYPYLFNGLYWDDLRTTWYQQLGTGIGWNWGELLRLPWTASLTLKDASFREARTGPFFVVMLPLTLVALVLGRKRQEQVDGTIAKGAFAVSAIQYALWTYGVVHSRAVFQARLLLPTLALFCLPVAAALEWLRRIDLPQLSLRRFLLIVLALTLMLNGVDLALAWAEEAPLAYLLGVESREDSLGRRLGVYYSTMQELSARVTSQDKVLFLWETKGYYCDVPCQPDLILDKLLHLVALEGSAHGVWRRLLNEGYTHVLLFDTGLNYMIAFSQDSDGALEQDDELAVLATLQAHYMDELYANDHYTLYRLRK